MAAPPSTHLPAPPALPPRVRLVVLFGGRSAEHDISCVTASHVLRAADPARYAVRAIGIDREGHWVSDDAATAALLAGTDQTRQLVAQGDAVTPQWALAPAEDALPVVVLPLLHGPLGEDGTVQGLLELADVPYVGSGVLGSAVCMDKGMAKLVASVADIPQCAWLDFTAAEPAEEIAEKVEEALGFPCFVKPSNLGSSVGITKAHDRAELREAIEVAFAYDDRIVVEEGVIGREVEVGVLGSTIAATPPRASVPGEIVPANEFYDYDDKYVDGAADLRIPADLPHDAAETVRALAVEAFTALRCEGLARVDFFYEHPGRGWLLNEVNTIPGFTPLSMYPKLFEASGVPYAELIDHLVTLALARHARRAGLRTSR